MQPRHLLFGTFRTATSPANNFKIRCSSQEMEIEDYFSDSHHSLFLLFFYIQRFRGIIEEVTAFPSTRYITSHRLGIPTFHPTPEMSSTSVIVVTVLTTFAAIPVSRLAFRAKNQDCQEPSDHFVAEAKPG